MVPRRTGTQVLCCDAPRQMPIASKHRQDITVQSRARRDWLLIARTGVV